jgi:hypothetical protein
MFTRVPEGECLFPDRGEERSVIFSEGHTSCTAEGEKFIAQCALHVVVFVVRAGDTLQHICLIYDCFLHYSPL